MAQRMIISIEVAGPDRKARRLHFGPEDDRLTSAAALRLIGSQEGEAIDLEQLAKVEVDAARDRALRYLGYRDRTRSEIIKRLRDDGYPEEVARSVCDRLCDLEFIDDTRLARHWAKSKVASGYGPRRIRQDLVRRGVPDSIAAEAVDGVAGDEVERARAVLRGNVPSDMKERQRLVRKLVSRGFELSTALRAVEVPDED